MPVKHFENLKTIDNQRKYIVEVISEKQDNVTKSSSIPADGLLPGVFYNYGILSDDIIVNLASGTNNSVAYEWIFRFRTDADGTCSVTLPATMPDGSTIYWSNLPDLKSDTIYECSISEGGGVIVALTETL